MTNPARTPVTCRRDPSTDTTDTVDDKLVFGHGQVARLRTYPDREKTLRENQALQRENIQPTDGVRAFANFPAHELDRLAEQQPSKYADLKAPDAEIRSRAIKKLVNSSEGREYRVGKPSRKLFRMPSNPLAKDA